MPYTLLSSTARAFEFEVFVTASSELSPAHKQALPRIMPTTHGTQAYTGEALHEASVNTEVDLHEEYRIHQHERY